MKKVLIFSLAYYPHVGGAEVAVKELTDRIIDLEFHMVTLRFFAADKPQERVGNVLVHRVGRGSGYLSKILFIPRAALAARRLHKKEKFDAAWAIMSYMLFPVVLARLHLPYVLTLEEGDPYEHMFSRARIWLFLPLLRWGFRHAAAVHAESTFLGTWARQWGFTGQLEIIHNGVETKKFAGEKVPHEGTVLITTSRLVHKNGLDTVIRALPELPGVHFKILGIGPDETKLKRLAEELGVARRVEFVGFVHHDRIPGELHRADIFIRPSRSEGMGNSFIEAMAAGLPVVATQEGGLMDFISSETAWPVPKDDPSQITLAIKEILGNPEHTNQVIKTALELVHMDYDWDTLARDVREKIFARLF